MDFDDLLLNTELLFASSDGVREEERARCLADEERGGLLLLPVGSPIAVALESGAQECRFPAGVLVVH